MNKLRKVLIIVFGAIFFISLIMVVRILVQGRLEQSAFDQLAAIADEAKRSELEPDAEQHTAESSPYVVLKEQNEDFFGWISIEDTKLDYPVMYTPDAPEYYLRRAFDGSYAESGVPFLSADCFDGCGNWLIYGHNMNNGTMFATLLSYAEEEFWQEHPVIEFDTLENSGRYEIMAAFYTKIYADGENGFQYYEYADVSDPSVFEEYVEQATRAALYDTGIRAEYGDQLITLSTCSYHTENGRFVVVGRQIR